MIGKKISRYLIEKKLGDGPMGEVWLATDDLIGRPVALRMLSESLAGSPEIRERFLREARLASGLTHPGIALVLDAGESDDQVFIAFEYVDGETIARRLSRGPLSEEQAIRAARDVAEALQHAHDQGLLHRDVNARNIMINREGHAKLMEFGFATRDPP